MFSKKSFNLIQISYFQIRYSHFRLSFTQKVQREQNINDNRDADDFIGMIIPTLDSKVESYSVFHGT